MQTIAQTISVRWADLDPNGHVRHSVYYDYGAQARIAFLHQHGFGIDWMTGNGIGLVLFREEAHFHRELKFGDELVVDVMLSSASADHRKWSLRHRILRDDILCATLNMDGAWLDLKKRRLVRPPRELSDRFSALPHTDDFQLMAAKQEK